MEERAEVFLVRLASYLEGDLDLETPRGSAWDDLSSK